MAASVTSSPTVAPRALATCPRRSARLIPAGSPQWVLLHLIRETLNPGWTPSAAADHLLEHVESCHAMRVARARLRQVDSQRATLLQARALATLNLAINRFEDTHAGSAEPESPTTSGQGAHQLSVA